MFRVSTLPCSLVLLIAAILLQPPLAFAEEAEMYFRGFTTANDGDRLEKEGETEQALAKFRQADEIFDSFVKTYPAWQPDMVDMRRKRVQDAILRLEGKLAQPAAAPASAPATAGGTPIPSQPISNPGTTFLPSVPAPGTIVPQSAGTTGPLPSLQDMFRQYEDAYRQRLKDLELENYKSQEDLRKWQTWYQWASAEITTTRADRDKLSSQSAQLEEAIEGMRRDVAAGKAAQGQLDALIKDKATLTAEIQQSNQKIAAAEKAASEASGRLAAASAQVAKLQESVEKSSSERDKLAAQNQGLRAENEELRKMKGADKLDALMAENERLKKDLEAARLQTESLKGDLERKDQEIASLKTELTGLKTELSTLRKESAKYQTQVAELTMQLKQIQGGEAITSNPVLTQENEMLREIIMRQLRTQYRQQRAQELVIAELQKMENASEDLLQQVQDLEGERMILTPEEEKLFTDPKVQEMLGQTGIQAGLVARSDATIAAEKDTSPPSEDSVDAILGRANEALQEKKYGDAARFYQDALRADPKNPTALIGLGYAHQRSGNYAEAEAALKKCLTFDPKNSNAAYALGVTLFKQERWSDALKPFEQSLEINPKNASARHYLGILSTKLNLLTRAEREFKTALAIDPNYGEAHFNLAVLYVTWDPPQWDKAKAAYAAAVEKGVPTDEALEKLLNGKKTAAN